MKKGKETEKMFNLTPEEEGAVLINCIIAILSPILAFAVVVVMFIVGMIQGGNYSWAKGCAIGLVIGFLIDIVFGILLGVAIIGMGGTY